MLPNNVLSTPAVPSGFSYPVKTPVPEDLLQGWEYGGVAIQDPSQGLLVKVWRAFLVIDDLTSVGSIYVEAPDVPAVFVLSGLGITDVDIAFDQNMNLFLCYTQLGIVKFYWYDGTIPGYVIDSLPAGCRSPRCCLDDHRAFNAPNSDILLGYVNPLNELCVRYQRDRYSVEYVLAGIIPESLVYIGMNNGYRVQFGMGFA
jgi:hypothetical protein